MLVPAGQATKTTMQSAAVATGNGTAATCTSGGNGSYTVLTMQIVGITTATITFEATIDGTNWIAVMATNLNTGSDATTATADGLYRVTAIGLTSVRARISAHTSGTIYVYGVATA